MVTNKRAKAKEPPVCPKIGTITILYKKVWILIMPSSQGKRMQPNRMLSTPPNTYIKSGFTPNASKNILHFFCPLMSIIQIGHHFTIDHGTGVVIGATCIIGNHVKLYQGVTLGAKSFPLDEEGNPIKGIPRHPILEDNVIVYSNATILGRVTIGRGATVGGNIWITEDVPAGARIVQRKH